MEINIRDAQEADYKEVMNLFGVFVNDMERYKNFDNDSYIKFLKLDDTWAKVAIIDDKIMGFISFSLRTLIRYPRPVLEVEELFVDENIRRMKLGSKLMEEVITVAKEKNCYYIMLASSKDRTVAHQFYKSLGFDEYAYHNRIKL